MYKIAVFFLILMYLTHLMNVLFKMSFIFLNVYNWFEIHIYVNKTLHFLAKCFFIILIIFD